MTGRQTIKRNSCIIIAQSSCTDIKKRLYLVMPKLMIDDKEVVKGDWIIVEGDGWSEIGCVVDIDDDEINMYDGKEGWTVNREEITQINWQ